MRDKFMEAVQAEGGQQPHEIKYMSVHCNILLVPVFGFPKLPKQPGIPCGNVGFLTSLGALCAGACAAAKILRKTWHRYSMTHIIIEPAFYGLKCSSKARSGATTRAAAQPGVCATTRAAAQPGVCLVVRVVTRAVEYLQVWTGGILCYAVQASHASAHDEHPIRQATSDDSAPRSAGAAKRK